MKLLILSDIHANVDALRAILERETFDAAYCAGDLTDYGPFPSEVLDLVRRSGIRCVAGNHDACLLSRAAGGPPRAWTEGEMKWQDENLRLISEEDLRFLQGLPETLTFSADGYDYLIAHSIGKGYAVPETRTAFRSFLADRGAADGRTPRLIIGHTHRQTITDLGDGCLWLNPGSVSYRRMDDPEKGAQYAVIDGGDISLRQVCYDRSRLSARTEELKKWLVPNEYHVADFFFTKRECDGTD